MRKLFLIAALVALACAPAIALTINPPISTFTINGHTYTNSMWESNFQGTLSMLAADIATVGGGVGARQDTQTLSAAGTNQSGATAITIPSGVVSVTGGSGGIKLPTCTADTTGLTIYVHDRTGAPIFVYPNGTDTITILSRNTAGQVLLAGNPIQVNMSAWFSCVTAGTWNSDFQSIVGIPPIIAEANGNSTAIYLDQTALNPIIQSYGIPLNKADNPTANVLATQWNPVDISGAGLTFTSGTNGLVTKVGQLCHLTFNVYYPTTSNTANASIGGMPSYCENNQTTISPGINTFATGCYSNVSTSYFPTVLISFGTGGDKISIQSPTGALRNNEMSGKELFCSVLIDTVE